MPTIPPRAVDEPRRLQALHDLELLDTPLEERFEQITRLACRLLRVPIAAISLVDSDRQWFKSIQGLDCEQTERRQAFCAHAIAGSDALIVRDAREDPRFRDFPLVADKRIVFYAGVPVRAPDGSAVGTVCVKDYEPRDLDDSHVLFLRDLARLVEPELRVASHSPVCRGLIERYHAEQRRARVDGLTRVWNWAGMSEIARDTLIADADARAGVAIILVGLDGLDRIIESRGLEAGGAVLRACAKRLLGAVRGGDVVGRAGADEFALVLSPCESRGDAARFAERSLERLMAAPISAGNVEIPVTACLGVHHVPGGVREDLDSAVLGAERALELARAGAPRRWAFSGMARTAAA